MTTQVTDISIGNRLVGPNQPCFIIAEIGINHNGDIKIAKRMIDAIAKAGADCVKFQTFRADEFCSNPDDTYEYISQEKIVRESMLEMFRRVEIPYDNFAGLFEYARDQGLIALSTPTDEEAVDTLEDLGTEAFKIGSDDIVYTPFLQYIATKGKPVIISAGMANTADIDRAVKAIRCFGNDKIIILHCVSQYPTPEENLNLRKIASIRDHFGIQVGFSDHSEGVHAAAAAVAMGSTVIEKHFTLDRNMAGPDHHFSCDPAELAELVKAIRQTEKMMGSGDIKPTQEEREMALISRRSIIAATSLPDGHTLRKEDVLFQRPGSGLLPYEIDRLVGRAIVKPVSSGELLRLDHFFEKEN